ncbi:MAG: aminoacyl-tRNA hydrolase [Gemmatimonadetes bacterium]|nr:aminoacyl-tRNA hydrolase [Gemmatimonadota bacterium]
MTAEGEADLSGSDLHAKVIVGIGNPGPRYDATRHNVGWWVVDRFAHDHEFGVFERRGKRLEVTGDIGGRNILLIKPRTFVNLSGLALTTLWQMDDFDAGRDLLVVTDDTNLEVGRVRLRPGGGTGGHKGLKSIAGVLGTRNYARLRIGVGVPPSGADLSDWVLSEMPEEDEDRVAGLLPELSEAVAVWAEQGVEAAMSQFNR